MKTITQKLGRHCVSRVEQKEVWSYILNKKSWFKWIEAYEPFQAVDSSFTAR